MLNFNADEVASSYVLGKTGEHNATELAITPPTELSEDERTKHYRVAFLSAGKAYLSEAQTGLSFNVALSSEITKNPRLSIQLIAYDNEGEFVGKSEKLEGFMLEPSISGTSVEIDGENSDIANEIINIAASLNSIEASLFEEIERATEQDAELAFGKVDKLDGKGLSSNDFTDNERLKLSLLENYDDEAILDRLSTVENGIEAFGEVAEYMDALVVKATLSDKKLDYLNKLVKGQVWDTAIDNTAVLTKFVPQGARAASINKIGGKTVSASQMLDKGLYSSSRTVSGIQFVNNSDGTISANGTATANSDFSLGNYQVFSGHKYLIYGCPSGGGANSFHIKFGSGYFDIGQGFVTPTLTRNSVLSVSLSVKARTTVENIVFHPQAFDLTTIFGAGNEPTAEQFRAMLSQEHYEFGQETLLNARCLCILSKDSSGDIIDTYNIPASLISFLSDEGYGQSNGEECNYIDFAEKKYYKFGSYDDGVWLSDVKAIDISQYLSNEAVMTVALGGRIAFVCDNNAPIMSEIEYAIKLTEAIG